MPRRPERPNSVLLVEDDRGDVLLMQEAMRESGFGTAITVVRDGEAAMNYLRREGTYVGATRPDLVLLDLNLPRKGGREVLHDVKCDPQLREIPVVVLSTSTAEEDISSCYRLQANLYVSKPVELEAYLDAVKQIDRFFATVVRLPPV